MSANATDNKRAKRARSTAANSRVLAIQGVRAAADAASLGAECVDELRSIFRAIISLSDQSPVIRDLAKVGLNLADQQNNLLDCQCEDFERQLRELVGVDHV